MTNKEALIAAIQIPGYSDISVQKALLDAGINEADPYVTTSKVAIDKAAIQVLSGMLAVASISEGGYSVGYSIEGIKAIIGGLEAGLGIIAIPKVRVLEY